jgi:hypothetical protein
LDFTLPLAQRERLHVDVRSLEHVQAADAVRDVWVQLGSFL